MRSLALVSATGNLDQRLLEFPAVLPHGRMLPGESLANESQSAAVFATRDQVLSSDQNPYESCGLMPPSVSNDLVPCNSRGRKTPIYPVALSFPQASR